MYPAREERRIRREIILVSWFVSIIAGSIYTEA
jgi:hypothetical protein